MTSTRLLVLGAVRYLQPVHGYEIRRELLSWGAEDWANVAPGSIYSALATLERRGLIHATGLRREDDRPERTEYAVTDAGDEAFDLLLREVLRTSELPHHPLLPGLAFLPEITPEELSEVLSARREAVERQIESYEGLLARVPTAAGPGEVPPHVAGSVRLILALVRAEADWIDDTSRRLVDGRLDHVWDRRHGAG